MSDSSFKFSQFSCLWSDIFISAKHVGFNNISPKITNFVNLFKYINEKPS